MSDIRVTVHRGPTTTIAEIVLEDEGLFFVGESKLHPKDARQDLKDIWIGDALALSRAFQRAATQLGEEAQQLIDGEPLKVPWLLKEFAVRKLEEFEQFDDA
jgi:hypothetical protein